ncbi:hypothetical protein H1S01_06275 [Heliobacterium chlorum]|uniref:Uncharacterized protein n=1 Tax=Heliobacterium chlorum TaxID=2698 RepID=A0ABR7T3I6_HELCL|nr:hypothetical protein [Heliobacterium chlorum]MBC9784116.1 hypothetical protein [Heliobacterium chlorum]
MLPLTGKQKKWFDGWLWSIAAGLIFGYYKAPWLQGVPMIFFFVAFFWLTLFLDWRKGRLTGSGSEIAMIGTMILGINLLVYSAAFGVLIMLI